MGKKIAKILRIILKSVLWFIFSIVALILLVLGAAVWILNPDQLTPLAEKYANEYLDADVSVGRIELTVWKTFPYATVDIADLTIISKSLDKLPVEERAKLPAYSDTLLETGQLHIGLNLLKLSLGEVALQDAMIDSPNLNLVVYSDSVANYLIVPPSNDTVSSVPMPKISINSLEINHCKKIRYFSYKDTLSAELGITAAQFAETESGNFQLLFDGNAGLSMPGGLVMDSIPFSIISNLKWSANNPYKVGISDCNIKVIDIPVTVNSTVSVEKYPVIENLKMNVGPLDVAAVIRYLPEKYKTRFSKLNTDLSIALKLKLVKRYILSGKELPSLDIDIDIPRSFIRSGKGSLENLALNAGVRIDGKNMDKSSVSVKNFNVDGKNASLNIKGSASNLISNTHIDATIKGKANIGNIIRILDIPLDFTVEGIMDANTKINIRLRDITKKRYERLDISGDLSLKDFHFVDQKNATTVYSQLAQLNFGTNNSVEKDGKKISGLLMMSISVDTLSAQAQGMDIRLKNGRIGAGALGSPSTILDTTKITPIGASVKADNIRITDPDSAAINIRNFTCNGTIRRFNHESNQAKFNLDINAARASYGDKKTNMNIREGLISLQIDPRVRKTGNTLSRRIDSLSLIYPALSRDSILILARKGNRKRGNNKLQDGEVMDMSVDNGFKKLLRKWNLSGKIQARRGRLFTPYFPVRNMIRNIDMCFSTDSFIINSARYRAGRSIFDINGGIRNIRGTLMGRNRKPLSVIFNISSDTLDVNQLIKTTFDGMAYTYDAETSINLADLDEAELERITDKSESSDEPVKAPIIPRNIDIDVNFFSKYGVYADMILHNMEGIILVHDGALHLKDIYAKTDIGSANFNALYMGKDNENIKFGFDMSLKDMKVAKFIDLLPAVDSIMPLLNDMEGIIDADVAATARVDSMMNIIMPSLTAAVKLHGDSLVLLDSETFKTIAKYLRFKNKSRNMIDNMDVEFIIQDSNMELFPFTFDMDRYRLGVMGHNDLDMNLNYHISVLKSPIPFKFGLNITGNADKMKFRLGGAKFKENHMSQVIHIVDTTRINLRRELEQAFIKGAHAALISDLNVRNAREARDNFSLPDTLTHEDSIRMINEGLIEAPKVELTPEQIKQQQKEDKKKKKKEKKKQSSDAIKDKQTWMIPPKKNGYMPFS